MFPADESGLRPSVNVDRSGLLRECPDCGLFQYVPAVETGEGAECVRCESTLRRHSLQGVILPLVCVCVASVLFAMALSFPIMSLHVLGRFATATVFTGPVRLVGYGTWELSVLMVGTLMVVPTVKLCVMFASLLGTMTSWRARWLAWAFGWLERITPWSMVEVFLVGAGVAYTRLHAIADVHVEPALIVAGGFVLVVAAADAVMDREAVWQGIGGAVDPAAASGNQTLPLIGCDVCGLVLRSASTEHCPRCAHSLEHRKSNSIVRVWACVIAAAVLYVPANLLPVMTIVRGGRGGSHTIMGGVMELAENHLYGLAVLVFVASVAVPILKLGILTSILVLTGRGSSAYLRLRTRLFKLVRAIGRWSMIDVFMVTIFVGLLHMGPLSNVSPDSGSMAFAAVVVLTMIATEALDPRLMWDAASESQLKEPVAT